MLKSKCWNFFSIFVFRIQNYMTYVRHQKSCILLKVCELLFYTFLQSLSLFQVSPSQNHQLSIFPNCWTIRIICFIFFQETGVKKLDKMQVILIIINECPSVYGNTISLKPDHQFWWNLAWSSPIFQPWFVESFISFHP